MAIYTRVSTKEQDPTNQESILRSVACARGWIVQRVYVDLGLSGALGTDQRPQLHELMGAALRREFDVVAVWDVSRLGRSLGHLLHILDDLKGYGCDLFIHQQGLDTTTPSGRMLFQLVGAFAEFERSMISERVKLGLRRAKERGAKVGRPLKQTYPVFQGAKELIEEGRPTEQICRDLGISRSTFFRIRRKLVDATSPESAHESATTG